MLHSIVHIIAIIMVLMALKNTVQKAYNAAREQGSKTEANLFAGIILIATIWAAVHLGLQM